MKQQAFALGIAAAMAAAPALAEPVTLTAGVFLPPQAAFAAPFARWAEHVNEACAEHVKIEITGPESIGSFEQPNALKIGVLDMLAGPGTYYKGDMIEVDALVLGDVPMTEQRENGAWEYLNRLHNEKMNAHFLTAYGDGVRFYIWSKDKSQDGRFDGKRLRSSPIYETFFQSLGATTVQLPPPEVYTALERGTVDGFGWPSWGIGDFGWDKLTNYQHGPAFMNVSISILANLDRWSALAPEAQACLTEQAMWLETQWPDWKAERDAAEDKVIAAAGIEYVDLGEDFAQAAYDTYWAFLTERSPEHVPALRALVSTK